MKKTVQRDMTKGSPTRIILGFTLPLFLGNVFQQFYNMADTIIVGQSGPGRWRPSAAPGRSCF